MTNNIAEGFGRFHLKDNVRFCRMAKGSYYELMDHLLIANEEGYIDSKDLDHINSLIQKGLKSLNGYIKYLNSGSNVVRESEVFYESNHGEPVNYQQRTNNKEQFIDE